MNVNDGSIAPVDRPSLSADEEDFFSSGGETEIPGGGDAGADSGGSAGAGDGGEAKPAGAKPADGAAPKNVHVPPATFLEEKKARKELATKYQDTEKQLAELRGKFAIIDQRHYQDVPIVANFSAAAP